MWFMAQMEKPALQTPWGDSQSLGVQMPSVPGRNNGDVRQRQKERLYGAAVIAVGEGTFSQATVSRLCAISGVSSRSFYELFDDKEVCLRQTVEAAVEIFEERLPEGGAADLEPALSSTLADLSSLMQRQPLAMKLCLNDALGGNRKAFQPTLRALNRVERRLADCYGRSPDHHGMPAELISARVGGVAEVIRARLRDGAALSRVSTDLVALLIADRPPPEPLRKSVRTLAAEPEAIASPDPAERAVRALAVLVARKGYANSTVEEIVREAQMSATTFYENFKNKNDLMGAAIDSACAQTIAAVMPAFSREFEWPAAIHAGYRAMLAFLASRPALAQLLVVGVYGVGDEAVQRRNEGLEPIGILIENNTAFWQHMPPVVYEMINGGVRHLILETVLRSGTDALPSLAPLCTYLTLCPFIGAEQACAVANGKRAGSPRHGVRGEWRPEAGGGAMHFRKEMRAPIFNAISLLLNRRAERSASATEIAEELGERPEMMSSYLKELEEAGVIEDVSEDGAEPRYRVQVLIHRLLMVSSQQLTRLTDEERQKLTETVWNMIGSEVELSADKGVFNRRLDRFMTRTPLFLDEEGWVELTDLHEKTLHAGFEIQARSTKRLEESGEEPLEARSVQLAFEMPKESKPDWIVSGERP
jgi:AcrR family transcriptional regulator/DNA-binding transcriptional ArsR family regulator